jgi:hypothetical protein
MRNFFSPTDRMDNFSEMILPDMFDSSGGPPGKYCHTGTGPSAHTYHSPSGLQEKKYLVNENIQR